MQVARQTPTLMVDNPLSLRVHDAVELPRGDSRVPELTYVYQKVRVERHLRDDPLGQMHAKGRYPLGDTEYRAGRQYQATREAEGIGRGRSSSDLREWVDGGLPVSDGLTDEKLRAAKLMAHYRRILTREYGENGYRIVEAVLIEKQTLARCALRFYGGASSANVKFVGRVFRECLSTLAREMGLMT